MTLPSFIIIGAQKCGTTSLYNYMIEHPQILPAAKKELHFFNWHSKPGNKKKAEGIDWYLSQFPTIPNGKNLITGEATPDYLVDPHTPQRMFNLLPDVKLIVLLRNPIDRAVSHYHHNRRISKKREPLPFKKAIEKEPKRLNIEKEKLISDENYRSLFHRDYSYLERGIYIEQLEKWMSIFPREQFLILKSEDFYENTDVTLKEVFDFLDLPNYQVTNKKKYNQLSDQPIAPKIRSTIAKYFQPYNQRLEEYLGMKFNWERSFDKEQNQHISLLQFKDKLDNNKCQLKQIKLTLEDSKSIPKSMSIVQKSEKNVVISDVSTLKEENRLFQIHNAIFQSIKIQRQTWIGGVVFPKDMPEKFRHRRGVTLNQFRYVDQQKPVNKNKSIIDHINNSKFYSGTYIYGGHFQPHFGHALTESIHRLWAFNSNIHDGIVFAISPRGTSKGIKYTPPQWFIQTLEILEIPLDKCVWVKNNCTFENLIIPEPGSELSIGLKEWYRPYLEKRQQRILDATHYLKKDKKELKLFLGRSHIHLSGYTAGEKYLENLLVNEGYISFKPENYNILEQISYLMSAKKIIFSEGSAIYSLEFINYLDADIACIPRRPDNQHFYPHIYSKCRNYIIAGNTNDILLSGIWRNGVIAIKQTPINKHPYQVVESLRNHDFAILKDWEKEKFFAQEKSDIMTHIYQVHTTLEKPDSDRYLEILEGYLQVRPNQNESLNTLSNLDIIERYLQMNKNQNESEIPETTNNIVVKNRSGRLNQLATINQSSNYLEIGVSKGMTFNAINIKNKVGVDPTFRFNTKKYATDNVVFLEVTSDEFFKNYAKDFQPFDLIYLDGMHTFEQTFRDFCASLSLAHGKTIWLIDDTCPGSYAQAQSSYQHCAKLKRFSQEKGGGWMGDVFKVVVAIHDFFPQFSFATFPDHGQTVVWNQWREDFQPLWNSLETITRLDYSEFVKLKGTLFKAEPYDEIFKIIKSAIT